MYFEVIQQFCRTLRNLDAILEKAIRHAEARKFDPNNFCTARLAPDMLPFSRQVQIACDTAKRVAASLSGREAPVHEDNEQTVAQLRERIQKCLAYLETFRPEHFKDVTDRTVVKIPGTQARAMYAPDALIARAIPNFYFHATTAYALLRAGGVEVGKRDYLGDLPTFDT